MNIKEIADLWITLPALKKFQKIGELINSDIISLKRIEAIKAELKERRFKK